MIVNVTTENFEKEVLKSEKPVIVDFWATWCGPCKMMHPVLDSIDQEYGDKIKICKVNSDTEIKLCGEFAVLSIPMFVGFKDGKQVSKAVGYMDKDKLLSSMNLL